ncbi:MAG: hypothetical protein HQ465_28240 [Rhodospirillales bacterium]|nr:hypothetical protein [Rhodospirillales bacterium]
MGGKRAGRRSQGKGVSAVANKTVVFGMLQRGASRWPGGGRKQEHSSALLTCPDSSDHG